MTHPFATLPHRAGPIPEIVGPAAHSQWSQIAPVMVQEELWSRMRSLPYTYMAPTLVSVSHARALHVAGGIGSARPERFQRGREFAHLHPPHDGSLHLSVPAQVMEQVVGARWGVPHPVQDALLVFGPRDRHELEVVWHLVQLSYEWLTT
ncbi:luciferase domain-containing protein [Nocardioides sp. JS614]|uniref:luciferase domain-containing protein n=1 Tax=Nocardioides sp. (strain ATCC BAA-499 / JS614) TaxID=196162 RepID=UPI003FCFF538